MCKLDATAFRVLAFVLLVPVRRVLLGGWMFSASFSLLPLLSRIETSCEEEGDVKMCLKVYNNIKY